MADLGEETDVDYSEENEETEEESQPVTNPLQPQAKPKKKKKEKKEMDMQKAQMEIQNKYYQKKLQQQSQRIKLLESQVEKLEPIENKKLSSLIINMQKTVKGFVTYVQKNPNPNKILNYTMKGDRALYLGLFGIIVFSMYLILKQAISTK